MHAFMLLNPVRSGSSESIATPEESARQFLQVAVNGIALYCGMPLKGWLYESTQTSIAKQRLQLELVSLSAEMNTLTTTASETRI
jgi:hypothetical protein